MRIPQSFKEFSVVNSDYELWLLLISHGASPSPPGHASPASKRRKNVTQHKGDYELWLLLISHGASPIPPGHANESPPASKRRKNVTQHKGDYEL